MYDGEWRCLDRPLARIFGWHRWQRPDVLTNLIIGNRQWVYEFLWSDWSVCCGIWLPLMSMLVLTPLLRYHCGESMRRRVRQLQNRCFLLAFRESTCKARFCSCWWWCVGQYLPAPRAATRRRRTVNKTCYALWLRWTISSRVKAYWKEGSSISPRTVVRWTVSTPSVIWLPLRWASTWKPAIVKWMLIV